MLAGKIHVFLSTVAMLVARTLIGLARALCGYEVVEMDWDVHNCRSILSLLSLSVDENAKYTFLLAV